MRNGYKKNTQTAFEGITESSFYKSYMVIFPYNTVHEKLIVIDSLVCFQLKIGNP